MKNMNENGRSMVEMLGVLAIIGVLSAGGLAGYSKAMYKYRVNETMNQLTMIVSNIRTLFGSQNTYAGLASTGKDYMTAADALKYGIITQEMANIATDTAATAQNPFKGNVLIGTSNGRGVTETGATTAANDEEAFYIEYDNLPAEACVTIVTSDWGSAAGSGLIGIAAYNTGGKEAYTKGTVNGEASTSTKRLDGRTITEANPKPFTIQDAVTACRGTSSDTSGNASVALKYY